MYQTGFDSARITFVDKPKVKGDLARSMEALFHPSPQSLLVHFSNLHNFYHHCARVRDLSKKIRVYDPRGGGGGGTPDFK